MCGVRSPKDVEIKLGELKEWGPVSCSCLVHSAKCVLLCMVGASVAIISVLTVLEI